ncbi:MAG: right-handed parallel beta-helix repeat-containing protein [Anaerolineaceae bacterium]
MPLTPAVTITNSSNVGIGGTGGVTPGGACTGDCNLISGNAYKGIEWLGSGTGNVILNNAIGTNLTGMAALGNGGDGVTSQTNNLLIDRNLLSGNGGQGISSGSSSTFLIIRGNKIGTDTTGANALLNFEGIKITNGSGAVIGGTLPGDGNVISGNSGVGIHLVGATNTTIQGNKIGANVAGAAANGGSGIWLEQPTANTQIGGFGAAARNVISGNGGSGVLVSGATNTGLSIQGNYIGLGADGATVIANAASGVAITDAPNVVIGGPTVGWGNVISGNGASGIGVIGAPGTSIQFNFIGTDATGLLDRGNAGAGVSFASGAANSTVSDNVISGNEGQGIAFVNAASTHLVRRNQIGQGADGAAPVGNTGDGVSVNGTANVSVGGASAGNAITNNVGNGVSSAGASGHLVIIENSISNNATGGITHTAPAIVAPLLSSAIAGSGAITGTFTTAPVIANTTFRVHYYANLTCTGAQGRTYLGSRDVTTDGNGVASVDLVLNATLDQGEGVTATVTDVNNVVPLLAGTSTFSNCVAATGQSVLTTTAGFTTTTPSVPSAAYAVPISSIPVLALTSLPRLIVSAPLDSVRIKGTPLDSVPLDSVPLDSVTINGVPLDSVPLDSVPLDSVPLDSVPLDSVSWANYLVGTPLEGLPTNNLTLADLKEWAPDRFHSLTLANVSLVGTLLKNASVGALALGSVPLDSVGQPPLAPLPNGVTICSLISCALGRTLLSAEINRSPLDSVPLDSVPLDSVPLDSVPLDSVPIDSLPVKAAAIGALPLDSVPLDSVPLDSVSIGDAIRVNRGLASTPLDSVPLDSVPLDSVRLRLSGLTLCEYLSLHGIGCGGLGVSGSSTILQLVLAMERYGIDPASSPLDSVPLDSVPLDSVPTGERTLAYFFSGGTIGGVQHRGGSFGGITLGQLLVALLDKSDYPWEKLPLDELGVTRFAFSGTPVEFALNFTITGGTPGFITDITVDLPAQFSHMASSPAFAGSPSLTTTIPAIGVNPPQTLPAVPLPAPSVTGNQLHWSLAGITNDTQNVLSFRANPGLIPAITSTMATVSVGTQATATAPIVVTVTEVGEPGNSDPLSALLTTMQPDTLYLTQISSATDIDYFKVPAPANPGSRIGIFLSHLGSDADMFVYGPVIANIAANPRDIPLQSDPLTDEGAGGVAAEQQLAPQAPTSTAIASLALRGASVNRGSGEEAVETLSGSPADTYTIRVAGYNGASSQQPYVLRVKVTPPPATPVCSPRFFKYTGQGVAAAPAAPSAGVNTLFIVDWKRLGDAYGSTAAADVQASLNALVAANIPHARAAVVPIDSLPGMNTLFGTYDANPCNPEGANGVVKLITTTIASWRALNPALDNIVILGSDELIPMARVPDVTRLSNERDYAGTFADRQGAVWASLLSGDILTDDPYGDFDPIPWLNRYLYVPDASVGRLVETPTQIKAALDLFVIRGGFIDPNSGLSTGYDFLSDGADAIRVALEGQPWAQGGVVTTLINETWTAAGLDTLLLPGTPPGVISLNSHFNHYQALPADQNAVTQTAAARLANTPPDPNLLFNSDRLIGANDLKLQARIIFSMGCHAGLSIIQALFDGDGDDPGRDLPDVAVPRAKDWPEVFARQGAIFIGNTGYGYGDTASVALSERLMLGFAKNLNGRVTLGGALWRAKQTYFSQLGLYGVYDEKVLMEATFYGLPMYRLGPTPAPGVVPPPLLGPTPPQQLPAPVAEPLSSLLAVAVNIAPAFLISDPNPAGLYMVATGGSTYTPDAGAPSAAEGGTQVTHYRPIEPRLSFDVTQANALAHGVLITSLTSQDVPSFNPVFSVPVIDMAAGSPEPQFESAAFPSSFQNVTTYTAGDGARTDGLRQNAVIIPGQYLADTSGPGTQRNFTSLGTLVYYAPNAGTDFFSPVFSRTEALLVNGQVSISVDVKDDVPGPAGAGAGTVRRVLALVYNGSPNWLPVELHSEGGTRWSAVAAVTGSNIQYFVQAVDASGNVSTSINKGPNFPAPAPLPPVSSGVALTLHGTPFGDTYVSDVRVLVGGGSTYWYSVDGAPFLAVGGSMEFTVTGTGPHNVQVQGADGTTASRQFVIAPTAPSITLVAPKDGAYYAIGQQKKASYTCGGGLQITSCAGTVASANRINTATAGDKTFVVNATDIVGRSVQLTVVYHVMDACLIPPTITGTSGNDTLNGTPGDDVIFGNGGNDKVNGNGGDDIICAGSGNDQITTGAGDDFIVAGGGNNKVVAGGGDNVVSTGNGNDSITAGAGNDLVTSGDGNNSIIAGDGDNVVTSGAGNDLITTGSGNDTISAGDGNNDTAVGDGNNTVTAGGGNDQVTTGSGNDTINAGGGNNKISAGGGNDTVATGPGNDKIDGGPGNDSCQPGAGQNSLTACE